jgi:hypothetical protein
MKKYIITIFISACIMLSGCNRTLVDTTWAYKYADIQGVGTVEVASWRDYENSDMIQISATDGNTYLTHSVNVVLRTK